MLRGMNESNAGQAQRLDERRRVIGLRFHGVRGLATGACDACVVEQNDRTVRGQSVRHRRIPVIHAATEMLQERQRCAGLGTEAPVGVPNPVRRDEPRRSRHMGERRCVSRSGRRLRLLLHQPHGRTRLERGDVLDGVLIENLVQVAVHVSDVPREQRVRQRPQRVVRG